MGRKGFLKLLSLSAGIMWVLSSCGGSDTGKGNETDGADSLKPVRGDIVRVHHPSDPDNLNPYNSGHATSTYIKENMFQALLAIDPATLQPLPVLAKELPSMTADSMGFIYEIREEAKWDNGSPVTAKDVAFSWKTMMNPFVDCAGNRVAHSIVTDIILDSLNPRKLTIRIPYPYFLGLEITGDIDIIPQYIYDSTHIMDNYSFTQIKNLKDEDHDEGLEKFAEIFNSEKFSSDPKYICGSGPYKLESWDSKIQVTLKRKDKWWADELKNPNELLVAWPDKIIYKIIPEKLTAFNSLKGEELDVMRDVPPKEFKNLLVNGGIVADHYNHYTPDIFSYTIIGMNNLPSAGRNKFFVDKRVRRAMAHLIDLPQLIENVYYGFGMPAISPVSKLRGEMEFNPNLKMIPFDLDKARALLKEAGWADTDNDGILDKMIDGKKVPFETEILIGQGSTTAPALCLHFQKNAERVGIKINIREMEFKTLTTKTAAHDFDMYGLSVQTSHLSTNLRQPWHSDSYFEGTINHWGFVNAEADALIEKIERTYDAEKRKPMYYHLQEIIYDEQPIIFVQIPKERLLVHKRFRNAKATLLKPNYKVAGFWVPKSQQKFH